MANNTFGIMVIIFLIIAMVIQGILLWVLRRRGVDINSGKVQIKVFLYIAPILFLPFWANPQASFKAKFISTFFGIVGGIINYFAVDRGGKVLRKILGVKDK